MEQPPSQAGLCGEFIEPLVVSHLQDVSIKFLADPLMVAHVSCVTKSLSRISLCATPWTVARQAPPSMGFSRQEYWSGAPFPSPGDLPDPGIKPVSLVSPALAGGFFTTSAPGINLRLGELQVHIRQLS